MPPGSMVTLSVTVPVGYECQVYAAVNKVWNKHNRRNTREPPGPAPKNQQQLVIGAQKALVGAKITADPVTRRKLCNKAERLLREASDGESDQESELAKKIDVAVERVDVRDRINIEMMAQKTVHLAKGVAKTGQKKTTRQKMEMGAEVTETVIEDQHTPITTYTVPPVALPMIKEKVKEDPPSNPGSPRVVREAKRHSDDLGTGPVYATTSTELVRGPHLTMRPDFSRVDVVGPTYRSTSTSGYIVPTSARYKKPSDRSASKGNFEWQGAYARSQQNKK